VNRRALTQSTSLMQGMKTNSGVGTTYKGVDNAMIIAVGLEPAAKVILLKVSLKMALFGVAISQALMMSTLPRTISPVGCIPVVMAEASKRLAWRLRKRCKTLVSQMSSKVGMTCRVVAFAMTTAAG